MSSRTSAKGREGEAGVVNYFQRYVELDPESGIQIRRIKSSGQNDEGDIIGLPFTCIEAKNHSNPVLGSLMTNAEWKAGNAKQPMWWLTYKRKGFSVNRAGQWNACTTVKALIEGTTDKWSVDLEILIRESQRDLEPIPVEINRSYGRRAYDNPHKWLILLIPNPLMVNMDQSLDRLIEEYGYGDDESRYVPVVVTPRRGRDTEGWYAQTRVEGVGRILETVGSIPQDPDEYS